MIYKNIKYTSYICSTANIEKKVIRSKLFSKKKWEPRRIPAIILCCKISKISRG